MPLKIQARNSLSRRQFLCSSGFAVGAATIGPLSSQNVFAEGSDSAVQLPKLAQPSYLASYIDPVFQSKVTRITGDPGTDIPNVNGKWDKVERHWYSKAAAWNCDQSLLVIASRHERPERLFLNGTSYEPLFGRDSAFGSDVRWHATEPNTVVGVKDNVLGLMDVKQDSTQVVATFEGYSKLRIGPGEGNLALDGRLIVLVGKKGKDSVAFTHDFQERKKGPDLTLNGIDIDWVSISASGKYMVLNGGITGKDADQTQVYDLEGNRVGEPWLEYGRPSHYDLTLDHEGDDIAVGVSKSPPDNGRVIKRRLRDGRITVLTSAGYATHTSTRNVNCPGWAFVTFQNHGPDWPPYWDEVAAVKLDGSMTVLRIAHLHTRLSDYLTEAHAVPSPDGKRVLWASNWESQSGRPIGAYVAELRETSAHV
jgi:hypothetical protein